MNKETQNILLQHAGHVITIWEETSWDVALTETRGIISADLGSEGGFDDKTPLYCRTCGIEIHNQAVRELVEQAVLEK